MKKLNKLQINPEKVMISKELVTLRGGYGEGGTTCIKCYSSSIANQSDSTFLGSTYAPCPDEENTAIIYCRALYPSTVSTAYWCGANC